MSERSYDKVIRRLQNIYPMLDRAAIEQLVLRVVLSFSDDVLREPTDHEIISQVSIILQNR